MKKLYTFIFVLLLFAPYGFGQTASSQTDERSAAPKRGPVFRANKGQVIAAQTMLKSKGVYSGEATGKLDPATRDSIKAYQKNNGLRQTGTLNRATLEKMGIALTEQQKAIPVSANSFASAKTSGKRDDEAGGISRHERADPRGSAVNETRWHVFGRRDRNTRRHDPRRSKEISGSQGFKGDRNA